MIYKNKFLLLIIILCLNLFSGCIKQSPDNQNLFYETETPSVHETKNGDQTVINLTMTNSKFSPDTITIPSGVPIELKIINRGTISHSFRAGKFSDKISDGFSTDLFRDTGASTTINNRTISTQEVNNSGNNLTTKNNSLLSLELRPREIGIISFIVPTGKEGEWEMGCFNYIKRKTGYELRYSGIINVE